MRIPEFPDGSAGVHCACQEPPHFRFVNHGVERRALAVVLTRGLRDGSDMAVGTYQ